MFDEWGNEYADFGGESVYGDLVGLSDVELAPAEFITPYTSISDTLRDYSSSGVLPSTVEAEGITRGFDWSQLGETFTKVGTALAPIVKAGGDIYAMVQGKPTTKPAVQQPPSILQRLGLASGPGGANTGTLLLVVGAGVGGLLLLNKRR
jgi:hypothetical protein